MVAKALNRPQVTRPAMDDDAPEAGMKEQVLRQLEPLLKRLKNRWVILALFLLAYIPFGMSYMSAYREHRDLQARIDSQKAVLALPEPRTDDIEIGLASWTAALQTAAAERLEELADSDLLERLLATASRFGVTIISASRSDNTLVPLGDDVYDATPVLLQALGDINGLHAFIAAIEDDAVDALEVQSSLITSQDGIHGASIRARVFNRLATAAELATLKGDKNTVPTGRVTQEELDRAAEGIR